MDWGVLVSKNKTEFDVRLMMEPLTKKKTKKNKNKKNYVPSPGGAVAVVTFTSTSIVITQLGEKKNMSFQVHRVERQSSTFT